MTQWLHRSADVVLSRDRNGFGTLTEVLEAFVTFAPEKYTETWLINRMTSKGVMSSNHGNLTLALPTLRVYRGSVGGDLLDRYGPIPDVVTAKAADHFGDIHEAVSETAIEIHSGESLSLWYTWTMTGPLANGQFDRWDIKFVLEGSIRHGF
jgi:hypothetical protein